MEALTVADAMTLLIAVVALDGIFTLTPLLGGVKLHWGWSTRFGHLGGWGNGIGYRMIIFFNLFECGIIHCSIIPCYCGPIFAPRVFPDFCYSALLGFSVRTNHINLLPNHKLIQGRPQGSS